MPTSKLPARRIQTTPLATPARIAPGATVAIDLALQGGGSHGAFTWGVLERLLDDESLALDGICGTSAGALNAAVLATGWAHGGRAGAQAALMAFWLDIASDANCFGATAASPAWNPMLAWFNQFTHAFSPYQFNPLGIDPLREVLQRHVQPQALQRGPLAVFVTATSVKSGQARVFTGPELSIEALLASACLPQIFQAVQIDGEPYWDGGYSGNPALWPLIYNTRSMDIVLVKINALQRLGTPDTTAEIADRVNEITFNAGLVAELRAIAFVQRLVEEGRVDVGTYKNLRLHMVADDAGLTSLPPSSKLNTERAFLLRLREMGRAAAQARLTAHRADVGQRSSLDIQQTFLSPKPP